MTLQIENFVNIVSPTDCPKSIKQYKLNDIPASFLNCESSFQHLMDTIQRIEKCLHEEHDVQLAYSEFVDLIKYKMDAKLPKRNQFRPGASHNQYKSRAKPYWTSNLQDLWDEKCKKERLWLNRKRGINSRSLKEAFCLSQKRFDKLNRQCKRKYLRDQQKQLQKILRTMTTPEIFGQK